MRAGDAGEAFANLVLQADGPQLGCHLAHETTPGRPGIAHLELRTDAPAGAVQGWLAAAAPPGPACDGPWAAAQARSLVCAALAAALRLLNARPATGIEPPAPTKAAGRPHSSDRAARADSKAGSEMAMTEAGAPSLPPCQ